MRVLLDTHTFLWFIEGNPSLSAQARRMIEDLANSRFLSVASVWEIAIKIGVNKLVVREALETFIPRQLESNAIDLLDITLAHVTRVTTLPLHHRDPFDRLLIAQATVEQMPIISGDAAFAPYAVNRLW